jgi:hypothetical protein
MINEEGILQIAKFQMALFVGLISHLKTIFFSPNKQTNNQ